MTFYNFRRPHQAMNNQMPMAVWRAGMDRIGAAARPVVPRMGSTSIIPFVTFDSEALAFLQAAVDRAWGTLPLDRRTPVVKERMAKAVMRSAAQGERDPVRLKAIAAAAVLAEPADGYDIEVLRQGDET